MGSQTVHQECLIVKHSRQVDLLYLEKNSQGLGFCCHREYQLYLYPLSKWNDNAAL